MPVMKDLLIDIITPHMDRQDFSCGEPALDMYLQSVASQDMKRNFATVFVACPRTQPQRIVAFYTLCAASVPLPSLPEATARKMPRYPAVPAVRLGRLAVDKAFHGQHIGSLLVLDALRRACNDAVAWALFLVDAKNDRAVQFYKRFLFQSFHDNALSLWMHRTQALALVHTQF